MYNGIGLTTPRGSGTNGHIQSNKFFVRPKSTTAKDVGSHGSDEGLARKPNRDILEHNRNRHMEFKLVLLEDKLADQGYTDSEIAEKISEARKNLELAAVLEASREAGEIALLSVSDNKVSDSQSHQEAAQKEKLMQMFRVALGIVPDAPLKKDEPKSNHEDGSDDDKISDDADKGLDDDVKLHKKDLKNRNGDSMKAVKVQKNESGRDSNQLRNPKIQHNKELGELTDSSDDAEIDEKKLRRISKKHQKYHQDSDKKSRNPSRENRKGRRHDKGMTMIIPILIMRNTLRKLVRFMKREVEGMRLMRWILMMKIAREVRGTRKRVEIMPRISSPKMKNTVRGMAREGEGMAVMNLINMKF